MDALHGSLLTLLALALLRNRTLAARESRRTGGQLREWRAASAECQSRKRARANGTDGSTNREERQ